MKQKCFRLILGLAVSLWANGGQAATLDVCKSGCTYSVIQDAIDAATSTDVVEVTDSGTYSECITMKDGINVISSTGVTPAINCTGGGTATVTFENGPITCNLDGFSITHSQGTGEGVFLDGTSGTVTATISNCNIYDIASSAGIRMNGVVTSTIEDNAIYDCLFAGIAVGQVGTPANVSNGSSITIQGNTIGDSTNPNQDAGIYLKGSGSVTVTIGGAGSDANTVHYNAQAGMRLDTITGLTIDNNTINNNTNAGILLIDVGSASGDAILQNNNINNNGKAGINIGGASYVTVGSNNDISYNSTGGVAFNMGDVTQAPGDASSGPVTITGNDNINNNTYGGIGIIDAISTTNKVIITGNDIYLNTRGGIGIQDACKVEITQNTVRNNVRGGIKTGDDSADPGGFVGTSGSANLTIRQNKIYGNGQSGYGGGVDVRHADGTVYNNLVYENHRGGMRFGDWIDEIINNTVSDNGNDNGTSGDPDDDVGGGIIYDDISAGDAVNAPPSGDPPAAIPIRNNICTHNYRAGIRACFSNTVDSEERDYNLVYANNATGETDCGYSTNNLIMSCANQNFGGCGGKWNSSPPPNILMDGPNNKIADPLFEDRLNDDYRIQSGSPAVDAGDPAAQYNDIEDPGNPGYALAPSQGTLTNDMGAYGGPNPLPYP